MAGRPRSVDDAAILRAAVAAMGRTGPARLTLAQIAAEAGVVPATLVQRFGSKRGLLLALAERTARDVGALCERARAAHGSPLAALDALVTELWGAMEDPDAYANHLAFLCADLADERLRDLARAAQTAQERSITALLADAADAGELRPGADAAALATAAQTAVTGAGLLWAVDRRGGLADRQRAALAAVLAPHLTADPRERE